MLTKIKQSISRITDMKELAELSAHISKRRQVLNDRRWLMQVAEAWERIKIVPVGTRLYVATNGTFFGGPFQRGDSFILKGVRRRSVVVEHGEKGVWSFPPAQVARYGLSTEPPENPMSADDRARVERIAERIAA